jgi:hypothetical protein
MVSVLPYRFPAIFDNSYSGQVGYAEVFVTGSGSQVVSVNAESVVNIVGASNSLSTAVLPFKFPTMFFEPYSLGAAQVVCDAVSPVAVEVLGDAVVSVVTDGVSYPLTDAVLPFEFPAVFTEPYSLAAAQIVCNVVSPTAVAVSGNAVAYLESPMFSGDITRFPFRLPARFNYEVAV